MFVCLIVCLSVWLQRRLDKIWKMLAKKKAIFIRKSAKCLVYSEKFSRFNFCLGFFERDLVKLATNMLAQYPNATFLGRNDQHLKFIFGGRINLWVLTNHLQFKSISIVHLSFYNCTMHYDTGLYSAGCMEKISVEEAVFWSTVSQMNNYKSQAFFCRKYPLLA